MSHKNTQLDYNCFHCFPKSIKRIRLMQDNQDKFTFLIILAVACIESDLGLLAFDILDTHLHYLVGIENISDAKSDIAWLNHKIKYFIREVNRRYGEYYRQKYNYSGILFSKNKDIFKAVPFADGIKNTIAYIHNNATSINKFAVYEDDPFNSYNYYLAAFMQNSEFQNLPQIKNITTTLDTLPIFKALNLGFGMRQFSASQSTQVCVQEFLDVHRKALHRRDQKNHNDIANTRYANLDILDLLNHKSQLEISESKGHRLKVFIDAIAKREFDPALFIEPFQEFVSFFPSQHGDDLKESFKRIRATHNLECKEFLKAISTKVSERKISELIGVSRDFIRSAK